MTVQDLPRRQPYTGNGLTTTFGVPFQFFQVDVYVSGVLRSLGADYTISQHAPGLTGSVVFNSPPANSAPIVIVGATAREQETEYVDGDEFPAAAHNNSLDRLTMIAQELDLASSQTMRASRFAAPLDPVDFAGNPNSFLVTDANGQPYLADASDPGNPLSVMYQQTLAAANAAEDSSDDATLAKNAAEAAQSDAEAAQSAAEAALEEIEAIVATIGAAQINKGIWDASAGTFPGSGLAQPGWTYYVSVAGTVNGVAFNINDGIMALAENASTATYAANWFKLDYTDDLTAASNFGTDNRFLRSDGTGKGVQASPVGSDDGGNVTGVNSLATTTFHDLTETTDPSTPAANHIRLYAKDDSGTTKLYTIDSAGSVEEVGAGGGGGDTDALFFSGRLTDLTISDLIGAPYFNGPDGSAIHDSFDTLAYVDVAGATNLSTSEAGRLKPTSGSDFYTSSYNPTLSLNTAGFSGYSFRQRVEAALVSTSGDRVRIKLAPPSTGANTVIAHCFIGHAATGDDFDGTQVRVTFGGGNNGVTLTAGGAVVTSDNVVYNVDETKPLLVSWEITSGDARYNSSASSDETVYFKAATSGEADDTAVSGYTAQANRVYFLDEVEVRTAAAVGNNLTVRSAAITAGVQPETIRVAAELHDFAGLTLNTDLTLEVSRDNGTTWATATLVEKFTRPGDVRILDSGDVDVSAQPAGSTMRWRWRSYNSVYFEIDGTALWGTA